MICFERLFTGAAHEQVVTVTMFDEPIKGRLKVTKVDKRTGVNCGVGFTFQVVSVNTKVDTADNPYAGFGDIDF